MKPIVTAKVAENAKLKEKVSLEFAFLLAQRLVLCQKQLFLLFLIL